MVTLEWLQQRFHEALAGRLDLALLDGFSLLPSETADLFRLFFKTSCGCGSAALLTLEVSRGKSLEGVERAIPGLLSQLENKVQQFKAMPCEAHRRMSHAQSSTGIQGIMKA